MRINDLLEKDFYGMSQSLWHVTKTYLFSSIFEKRYFETSSLSDKDEMEAVIHALYPDVDINSEEFLNLVTEFEYDRYMSFSKRSNNDYAKLVIENAYPVNIEFHKAKLINDFNFIDIDYMKYRNKKEKMNRTEDATEYRLLTNQYRLYIYNSNYIKAIHICSQNFDRDKKYYLKAHKKDNFKIYLYPTAEDTISITNNRVRIK